MKKVSEGILLVAILRGHMAAMAQNSQNPPELDSHRSPVAMTILQLKYLGRLNILRLLLALLIIIKHSKRI